MDVNGLKHCQICTKLAGKGKGIGCWTLTMLFRCCFSSELQGKAMRSPLVKLKVTDTIQDVGKQVHALQALPPKLGTPADGGKYPWCQEAAGGKVFVHSSGWLDGGSCEKRGWAVKIRILNLWVRDLLILLVVIPFFGQGSETELGDLGQPTEGSPGQALLVGRVDAMMPWWPSGQSWRCHQRRRPKVCRCWRSFPPDSPAYPCLACHSRSFYRSSSGFGGHWPADKWSQRIEGGQLETLDDFRSSMIILYRYI